MSFWDAIILGIIQGITEFLPISSSGHLEIAKYLFGIDAENSLLFTVVVHAATVFSTIIIFGKDISQLFCRFFSKGYKEDKNYVFKLLISMIPIGIVALFFKDKIELLFNGNIVLVGCMLVITSLFLAFTFFRRESKRSISFLDSFIIGIAQAIAVIPGISRSGATIATGMIIGNDKSQLAKFSFLMVIIPILGELFIDCLHGNIINNGIGIIPLIAGFVTAFICGLLACKLMLAIVKKGKLIWFAIYCLIAGSISILLGII